MGPGRALDRPSEAEKVLRRGLAISPDDPQVLLHLGRSLAALDRPGEAQTFLEKFRKVRPALVREARLPSAGGPGIRERSHASISGCFKVPERHPR